MTSTADVPVESGQDYSVTDVDGHQPGSLNDFVGEITITLVRNGHTMHVAGAGSVPTADSVRFYQKDLALHDRDIRVWTITSAADRTFFAAPYAAF